MITNLFPSSILYSAIGGAQSKRLILELLDEAYKIREVDEVGQKWSKKNYPGGYTSYGSMSELHKFSSTFSELELRIRKHVSTYAKYLELDIRSSDLSMKDCWVNIMPPQVSHSFHIHPLNVISGTVYLKTPKKCSAIRFEDPRMSCFMASPARKPNCRSENKRYIDIEPKVGHIVLFESWMNHEVPRNQASTERVSVSFNYHLR